MTLMVIISSKTKLKQTKSNDEKRTKRKEKGREVFEADSEQRLKFDRGSSAQKVRKWREERLRMSAGSHSADK
jgi:hypothetical protein